ncbi:hypothetical protein CRP143_gp12 [Roseobacter phage CRP-143]|nr:hypothetical protein CRP143_gp12 [Roseobacter phage CRP-143]
MTDRYLILGKDGCSYCTKAKHLLDICDATYEYMDFPSMSSDRVARLEAVAGGEFRTMPQIFRYTEGDNTLTHIGGYRELSKEVI